MAPLRIGSLFTGTGALDLAVMDVFDAEVVWHSQYEPPDKNGKEDKNQYAAKILERHWPGVPNLWDITKVDWQAVLAEHGPIDILTGGFPCQDVSTAGKRAGLTADSRSGLWSHMARAIHELRPRLVVIENVEGLLSAEADRGVESGAEAVDEGSGAGGVLRAVGAVLGDLATLGFDAEWARVAASEVGAPHGRKRVFVYAWPASVDPGGLGRWDRTGFVGGLGAAGRDTETDADAADLGHERGRDARRRGHGPADRRQDAADTERIGLQGQRSDTEPQPRRQAPTQVGHGSTGSREAAADPHGGRCERHQERNIRPDEAQSEREPRLDAVRHGVREQATEPACPTCLCPESFHDAGGFCAGCAHCTDPELGQPGTCPDDCPYCAAEAPADAEGDGRDEGRPEPARQQGRPHAAERGDATPANADGFGGREAFLNLRPGQPDLDWGDYEPAIRRWEQVLGRPAPWPTDALGRLSAVFTEWMMGLPDGWVTCTPGLTRSAMLKALGNGVVRLQAATALVLLHRRAVADAVAGAQLAA